jgi:hypothetical protein
MPRVRSGGSRNVVSDRFVQRANRRIAESETTPAPSSTTATGFPRYGSEVKTST